MDAVSFLDKWNKICAYMVDVNDMSCRNCELDDICGKLCSKPGEATKEECKEFVKKVNKMYKKKEKDISQSYGLDPSRTCRDCKYAGRLVNLEPCYSCSSKIIHTSWEPKEESK